MRQVFFIFFFAGVLMTLHVHAQQKDSLIVKHLSDSSSGIKDSLPVKPLSDSALEKSDSIYAGKKMSQAARDSIAKKKWSNPKRATIYSTCLPGLGQVYNKKYWKVPIVYAAIGIPAYLYFYNKSFYNKAQYALTVTVNGSTGDSLAKVSPEFLPLVLAGATNDLITVRDQARTYQDYSVLFFLLFYGLNIIDATVDAHLKDFNVSSDLSFQIRPMILPGPTPSAGITLAFDIHKPKYRILSSN